ncbi:MAG: anti-sigma factor domain-containing protein [Actinomycetota bacterium]
MSRTARGDSDAFTELYDALAGSVYGIVLTVLRDPAQSEEVAQEVLVEVWRRAARYDAERGSVTAWVLTMAHRRAVDRVRSAQATSDREERVGRASSRPATGRGTVIVAGERVLVVGDGVPDPGDGRAYQLWFIGDDGPGSAGMHADADGHVWADARGIRPGEAVGVTVEPAGGSDQPTTDPVLLAEPIRS